MSANKQLTLPITGMTCANCTASVERNLMKVGGVQIVFVNIGRAKCT